MGGQPVIIPAFCDSGDSLAGYGDLGERPSPLLQPGYREIRGARRSKVGLAKTLTNRGLQES